MANNVKAKLDAVSRKENIAAHVAVFGINTEGLNESQIVQRINRIKNDGKALTEIIAKMNQFDEDTHYDQLAIISILLGINRTGLRKSELLEKINDKLIKINEKVEGV